MDQGSEPGRDDDGLPRVDVQIPDDARELDRDVQAYRRELRAQRRHDRSLRVRAPLRRSGMIVPLIAGCLILAMIAAMVLTMFTANPIFSGIAGPGPASRGAASSPQRPGANASAGPTASPGQHPATPAGLPARLPAASLAVSGGQIPLGGLRSTALAMIPASCGCASGVSRLIVQARSAGIRLYLVTQPGGIRQVPDVARAAGSRSAVLAVDRQDVLFAAYRPGGLTVLMVDSQGNVDVAPLSPGFDLRAQLASLRS